MYTSANSSPLHIGLQEMYYSL